MTNAVAHAGLIYDEVPHQASEDERLIEACQAGDDAAFRSLYRAHRSEVHRVVYRLLGPSEELEDVIQDVFLQVHRSLGNFRGHAKFSTWLHRVAVNVTLQHIRRKKTTIKSRFDERLEERPEDQTHGKRTRNPHENFETQDRLQAVYRALDQLSEKKRAVLVMHDMQGMSAKKIAKVVGAPIFTVRTRLFYARREFYKKITKDPAFAGDITADELSRK